MSRQTSGIIINDDIFINSNHVVKMEKYKVEGDSDSDSVNDVYVIDIYMTEGISPVRYNFNSESSCNEAFKKIILEMYSYNYAIVNFKTKEVKDAEKAAKEAEKTE